MEVKILKSEGTCEHYEKIQFFEASGRLAIVGGRQRKMYRNIRGYIISNGFNVLEGIVCRLLGIDISK